MSELRERVKQNHPNGDGASAFKPQGSSSDVKDLNRSSLVEALITLAFVSFFLISMLAIHSTQLIGSPLYFINRDYFYAYMAFTKQCFGIFTNSLTQWFTPTVVRVSGDKSVQGQLKSDENGLLETKFPERLILISNHQIYTDWLYLWWISYTSRMHGHIYIILKESLKYIPLLGPGMMFYGFIFMARSWAKDKSRLHSRLQSLNSKHQGPLSGSQSLDPMWLLIFPEGTNLSPSARESSLKWSKKTGLDDMKHQILPRSTGLQFCLQELRETVDWVYDCTIAYEGIPHGEYGQDIFTLPSMVFKGRIPKSVNIYWRAFKIDSIPIDDTKMFEKWLLDRWREKDNLLEQYHQTGRFPRDESGGAGDSGFIDAWVQPRGMFEVLLIFAPLIPISMLLYGAVQMFRVFAGMGH